MRAFFQIHTDQPAGDVLIFLPGQEDIESLQKSIDIYSKQLPADKPAVSLLTHYNAKRGITDLFPGPYMYNVCRPRSFTE